MMKTTVIFLATLSLAGCAGQEYCLEDKPARVCTQFDADGECKAYVNQETIQRMNGN